MSADFWNNNGVDFWGGSYQKAVDIAGNFSASLSLGAISCIGVGDSRTAAYASDDVDVFSTYFDAMIGASNGKLRQWQMNHESLGATYQTSYSGWYSYEGNDAVEAVCAANPSFRPKAWFWQLGYNDRSTVNPWTTEQLAALKAQVSRAASLALQYNAMLILVAEPPHTGMSTAAIVQLAAHNRWLAVFAEYHPHCLFVPVHHVLTDPTTGLLFSAYTDDNPHLNAAGAKVAGDFVADYVINGGAVGVDPYAVVSNAEVWTTTNQVDGAACPFASGNVTLHTNATGWATTGGLTLTRGSAPSGTYGVAGVLDIEKTNSGIRYAYGDMSTFSTNFATQDDELYFSCRQYVESGSTNVRFEFSIDIGATAYSSNRVAWVTSQTDGEIHSAVFKPGAVPTRYRAIFTIRDQSTFGANQTMWATQFTMFNIGAVKADVKTYALFPERLSA